MEAKCIITYTIRALLIELWSVNVIAHSSSLADFNSDICANAFDLLPPPFQREHKHNDLGEGNTRTTVRV